MSSNENDDLNENEVDWQSTEEFSSDDDVPRGNGINWLTSDDDVYTNPLIQAIEEEDIDLLRSLLESGEDVHMGDDNPLMLAIDLKNIEMVKLLIEKGANIHARENEAVISSVFTGNLEIAKILMENIEYQQELYHSLLRVSFEENHSIELIKYIMDFCVDKYDMLILSIEHNSLELVKYLIDQGVDIHVYNEQALQTSIEEGNLEIVQYLIEHGADINNGEIDLNLIYNKDVKEYIQNLVAKANLFENVNSKCNPSHLTETEIQKINKYFKGNWEKDEICNKLTDLFNKSTEFKNKMIDKCYNDTTILLTPLKEVPGIFFYNKEINGKLFCGDIRELSKTVNGRNPWTNEPFENELSEIRKELEKYESVIKNLDDDSEEILETMEMTIRRVMNNVLNRLRYPASVENFIKSNDIKITDFINELQIENVISENDKNNINTISDTNAKKLAIGNLLNLKINNDTTIINVNGNEISSLLIILEEVYNKVFGNL